LFSGRAWAAGAVKKMEENHVKVENTGRLPEEVLSSFHTMVTRMIRFVHIHFVHPLINICYCVQGPAQ